MNSVHGLIFFNIPIRGVIITVYYLNKGLFDY